LGNWWAKRLQSVFRSVSEERFRSRRSEPGRFLRLRKGQNYGSETCRRSHIASGKRSNPRRHIRRIQGRQGDAAASSALEKKRLGVYVYAPDSFDPKRQRKNNDQLPSGKIGSSEYEGTNEKTMGRCAECNSG